MKSSINKSKLIQTKNHTWRKHKTILGELIFSKYGAVKSGSVAKCVNTWHLNDTKMCDEIGYFRRLL